MGGKEYRGTDAKDITRFILDGRKKLGVEIAENRDENGSFIALPAMAQFSRTRCIRGTYLFKGADALKHFDDSIGCTGHWRKPGIVYEIPYLTLVAPNFAYLLASGRSISASGDAWEATRVIAPAAVTGQAAGDGSRTRHKEEMPRE